MATQPVGLGSGLPAMNRPSGRRLRTGPSSDVQREQHSTTHQSLKPQTENERGVSGTLSTQLLQEHAHRLLSNPAAQQLLSNPELAARLAARRQAFRPQSGSCVLEEDASQQSASNSEIQPADAAPAAFRPEAAQQGLGAVGGTLGDVMPADTMAQFMAAAHDPQQFEAFLARPEFQGAMAMLGSKWQAQQMGVDGLLKRKHLHEPVDHLAQQAHAAHHHSRPHSLHDHHQYSDSLHQECDCQHQHAHNQGSVAVQIDGHRQGSHAANGQERLPVPLTRDGKPDPKFYYEPVEPSDWQPPRPDTCLELYRKAYCSQADVAFPLLFWASLVGLCYSAALPLWGIVLVALPYFVGGTQLFIVKGAGIRPRNLQSSRMMATMVLAIELITIAAFAMYMMPLLVDCSLQALLCLGSAVIALLLHVRSARLDPGYVQLPHGGQHRAAARQEPEGVEEGSTESTSASQEESSLNMGMCDDCHRLRPLRSKHCHACKRCVKRFDHHCPVANNCIGANNQRSFIGFTVALLLAQLLYLRLSTLYFLRAVGSSLVLSPHQQMAAAKVLLLAARQLPGLVLLTFLHIPLAVGNVFLVLRAACCVSANLTVCELLTRKRYAYLTRDGDGAFVNPFDRGVASNCIQFWGGSAPDWGQELHVGTEDGGAKGSQSPISSFFLRLDVYRRRLQLHRLERRRSKEQNLLERFG